MQAKEIIHTHTYTKYGHKMRVRIYRCVFHLNGTRTLYVHCDSRNMDPPAMRHDKSGLDWPTLQLFQNCVFWPLAVITETRNMTERLAHSRLSSLALRESKSHTTHTMTSSFLRAQAVVAGVPHRCASATASPSRSPKASERGGIGARRAAAPYPSTFSPPPANLRIGAQAPQHTAEEKARAKRLQSRGGYGSANLVRRTPFCAPASWICAMPVRSQIPPFEEHVPAMSSRSTWQYKNFVLLRHGTPNKQ